MALVGDTDLRVPCVPSLKSASVPIRHNTISLSALLFDFDLGL